MRLMLTGRRLALVTALLLVFATPASAAEISFSGAGWGHGVGLSQYGAKAMGADGNSYEEIIGRYFTGVRIVSVATASSGTFVATDPTPLLIGLLQDSNSVLFTIASGAAQLCFDPVGPCVTTAKTGESFRFSPDGSGGCVFLRVGIEANASVVGTGATCRASVRPLSDQTAVRIPFKARTYSHGTLRFRQAPSSEKIHTVYEIGIDDYLMGVSEVPDSWPMAAIEAQVVTSRSYVVRSALDRGHEGSFDVSRKEECFCNIRDDTSDLVFRGKDGEIAHPRWVSAVASTAQKVMSSGGTVALGLYSSSSGGWTETYSDVFVGADHPYLISVFDSPTFSESAANPYASWAAGYSQDGLATAFGFSWISDVSVTERNQSGSARTVRFAGIIGGWPAERFVSALEVRETLSLRSTTFGISVTSRFDDVLPDYMFAGEVLGLHELGITLGCTATAFCPDRAVTRAEMAAFLTRAFSLDGATSVSPFADSEGHVLEAEIGALRASGITLGCTATAFCPDRAVTRAEMAAFLVRAVA